LRHEVQARDSDVHSAVLKGTDLRTMKPGQVCKFVLSPAAHQAQLLDPSPEPLLNLFALQQKQFQGILLKRILLIRRHQLTPCALPIGSIDFAVPVFEYGPKEASVARRSGLKSHEQPRTDVHREINYAGRRLARTSDQIAEVKRSAPQH
jgi:hypothetical protein